MAKLRLTLRNIGVFRDENEFVFDKGLNILYAPNASGKSSVIEGLRLISTRVLSQDELREALNDYEDEGYVRFELEGKRYEIRLTRKPDGTVKSEGKTISDNGVIKTLCFVDIGNELISAIFKGDPNAVKEWFTKVTGIMSLKESLRILENLHSEHLHRYELKKREYEARKREVEKNLMEVEKRIKDVRKRIDEILSDPRIQPILMRLEDLGRKREEIERRISSLRGKLTDKESKIGIKEVERNRLDAEAKALRERYEEELAKLEELRSKEEEARREIEELEKRKIEFNKKLEEIKNEMREIRSLISKRQEVIKYSVCPYCGAPVDREKIEEELEDLREKQRSLEDQIYELEREISQTNTRINILRESYEERLKELEKSLKELGKTLEEKELRIRSIEREISNLKQEVKTFNKEIEELSLELSKIGHEMAALIPYKDVSDEYRKLLEEEEDLRKRRDNLTARLRQIEMLYQDLKELEKNVKRAELLKRYFEIRIQELTSLVVAKINESLQRHFKLLKLAEFDFIGLNDDFSLSLVRSGGIVTQLGELSDAEKALLGIILTFVAKSFIAPQFPLYAIDSVTEMVDEGRLKAVLEYLKEEALKTETIVMATKNKPFTGTIQLVNQSAIYVNKIPF